MSSVCLGMTNEPKIAWSGSRDLIWGPIVCLEWMKLGTSNFAYALQVDTGKHAC